jgi:drug/metabolite transporter (DMT)-like permease
VAAVPAGTRCAAPLFVRIGMEELAMSGMRVIGIVLAVVGVVLLFFGITASDSLVDQASKTFTGRFTQQTMIYIIVGVVLLVGGGLTALSARRR